MRDGNGDVGLRRRASGRTTDSEKLMEQGASEIGSKSKAKSKAMSKKGKQGIEIVAINVGIAKIRIEGIPPGLICDSKHGDSVTVDEKGREKAPRTAETWQDALYPMPGKKGKYGFPGIAFRKALIAAARNVPSLDMAVARGLVFVPVDFVEIHGVPEYLFQQARNKQGQLVPCHRAIFKTWWAELTIEYDASRIKGLAQLGLLVQRAGWSVGAGCQRAERGGNNGRWRLKP